MRILCYSKSRRRVHHRLVWGFVGRAKNTIVPLAREQSALKQTNGVRAFWRLVSLNLFFHILVRFFRRMMLRGPRAIQCFDILPIRGHLFSTIIMHLYSWSLQFIYSRFRFNSTIYESLCVTKYIIVGWKKSSTQSSYIFQFYRVPDESYISRQISQTTVSKWTTGHPARSNSSENASAPLEEWRRTGRSESSKILLPTPQCVRNNHKISKVIIIKVPQYNRKYHKYRWWSSLKKNLFSKLKYCQSCSNSPSPYNAVIYVRIPGC